MVNTEAYKAVNAVALLLKRAKVVVAAETLVPMPVSVSVAAGDLTASAELMIVAVAAGEQAAGAVKKAVVDTANKAIVIKATDVQVTDKEAMVNTEALMMIMMIAVAVNAVALTVAVAAEAKVPMPVTVPVVAGAVAVSAINMMAAVVGEIAAGAVKK